jgi:glycosyltransferase involved in cell wall biosynthesis
MKMVSKEIPDVKCICLGTYKYGDEDAFRRALRDSGMDRYIEMLPVVPFRDVPAYIAVSRVGLILFQPIGLEHTFGMPHKMFDYMREGIPVIAPEFAIEIKRVIEEAGCGLLIDVTDPKAIADAIIFLLRNPDESKRLGANGRKIVETKYNWEAEEKKLLEVFASLEQG